MNNKTEKSPRKKKWIERRRKELLASMSAAEIEAGTILMSMGYTVVKQYPIDTGRHIYFADIYIKELRLIMEIDGGYHNTLSQKRHDRNRSSSLRRKGYHVCRLSNQEARKSEKIAAKLKLFIRKG